MSDYRKMFDSEYLANWDLDGDVTVEIHKVVGGEVRTPDGSTERKPFLYFKGAKKAMVVNKTNGKIIAGMYGNDSTDWIGKSITLYATTCSGKGGDTVDCIRIRPGVPKTAAV